MTLMPVFARVALAVSLIVGLSTPSMADPASSLDLLLRVSPPTVRRDQRVTMEVLVQNRDRRRVVLRGVPGFTDTGGISLVVIDASGVRTPVELERGELSAAEVRSGERRTLLNADEALGTYVQFNAAKLFPKAGRYEIVASYASPHPSAGNRSVVAGEVEGSQAVSQPVAIEVTQ